MNFAIAYPWRGPPVSVLRMSASRVPWSRVLGVLAGKSPPSIHYQDFLVTLPLGRRGRREVPADPGSRSEPGKRHRPACGPQTNTVPPCGPTNLSSKTELGSGERTQRSPVVTPDPNSTIPNRLVGPPGF